MRRAPGRLVAALLAATLAVSACGGSGEADAEPGGKALVVAVPSLSGAGQDIITTLTVIFKDYWDEAFDYTLTQDGEGNLEPGLATSWEVSDDHLTWTFNIREGVIFHNGDELTAEDVAFTWNRIFFDPGTKAPASTLAPNFDSIEAEGNQVIVKMNKPDSTFPWLFSSVDGGMQGTIFPKDYFEEVGAVEFFKKPIGTGPYEIVETNGEQAVKLKAFRDENRSDWQKERTARFDTLEIQAVTDSSTRLAMLRTGEADLAPLPISMRDQVESADLRTLEAENVNFSNMWCFGFTTNLKSPCNDQRVREALSIAIDREAIATNVYGGAATPINGFFAGPGTFGYPEDLAPPPFDPDRAKSLLADAGFSESNPLKVQISVYDDDVDFPAMPTMAEAIAGYYKDIGVDTNLLPGDWNSNKAKLRERDYPGMQTDDANVNPVTLFLRGMDNRTNMITDQVSVYTEYAETGAAIWETDNLPKQTELIDAVMAEFDLDKQAQLFGDYIKWSAENYIQIPLLSSDGIFGVTDDVGSWDDQVAGKLRVHNLWSVSQAAG